MDFELSRCTLFCIRYSYVLHKNKIETLVRLRVKDVILFTYIINVVLALMVVMQLFLRLILCWMRVKEEIGVSVAVVLNFDLLFLTIQKWEV